jgi:predicted transporter
MHFSEFPYLDPGSGSILIQILIAALLGAGVFIRSQWTRIKKIFGIKSQTENDGEEDEESKE